MCTASWLIEAGTLRLFFNRDELRTREGALPPALDTAGALRWVAPRDGRAGGTWIAVTAAGATFALLNKSGGQPPAIPESRGRLIPRLVGSESPDHLAAELVAIGLARYAPFRLLALWHSPAAGVALAWDGETLERVALDPALGLLCSSGLGDERATRERGATWEARRRAAAAWSADQHRAFHRDHAPAPSAWSVCVHRPEAATVSFTEIELAASGAKLRYRPGSPCLDAPAAEIALPAAVAAGRSRA